MQFLFGSCLYGVKGGKVVQPHSGGGTSCSCSAQRAASLHDAVLNQVRAPVHPAASSQAHRLAQDLLRPPISQQSLWGLSAMVLT